MNKLDLAIWYGEHSTQVFLLFAAPVALLWYFYFEPHDQQELTWVVIGGVAIVYFWSVKYLRTFCYDVVSDYAKKFSNKPDIIYPTSEDLIDRIDIEIISIIDEQREEKGDYFKIIGNIDLVEPNDLFERLGKLKVLGYIHSTPKRLTLTSLGLQTLDTNVLPKATVPAKFSVLVARAKIQLEEGNFNGVSDTVNILFEDILRNRIDEQLQEKLDETWDEIRRKSIVKRNFDKVSLGELVAACRYLNIISQGSMDDHILSSFMKLRTPQKHSTGDGLDLQQSAKSAFDLASVFIRHWFK